MIALPLKNHALYSQKMIRVTKNSKISKKELKLGIPIEFEHTNSRRVAKRIASQHIIEFPSYYSKGLLPMERKLKSLKGGSKK